jgi:hypothetical protein
MIEHAFHHFLGAIVTPAKSILIVNNFDSPSSIEDVFFSELVSYVNQSCTIDSLSPIPKSKSFAPRINQQIETIRDYGVIILNTPSAETNVRLLETMQHNNNTTKFIVNNETADRTDNLTVIPFVHNMNIIYKASNNYTMAHLPPFYLPYNFNMAILPLNKETDLLATRISQSKCMQSGISFMLRHKNTIKPIPCNSFLPSHNFSYEDPRLFGAHGHIYLQYVKIDNYKAGVHTCLRQQIAELRLIDDEVKVVKNYIPQLRENARTGPEKNWIFWPSPLGDQIICAYYPTQLFVMNKNFEVLEELPEQQLDPDPEVATALKAHRGGSPGVLHKDKIFCFTHTNRRPKGQLPEYNIGVIVYSATAKPKILAYGFDIYDQNKNLDAFFYVCGAIFDEGSRTWHLTGGTNDTKSSILIVSEAEVESKLQWLTG